MSFVDGNNGMYMPVAPAGGNGFGGFGGDGGWWLILFLFALMGNWGNGFGGNNDMIPYLLNQQTQDGVSRGFDTAAITGQISSLQNSVNTGFSESVITGMNQSFALQSQLSNCCCENRLAIANLSADIARENCADRQAVADGVQKILDQMCADKIDAKNEKIVELQNQLTMANLAASQNLQTAQIIADNAAQTAALEKYLSPTPIPAYVVSNPNGCNCNNSCGTGFYN